MVFLTKIILIAAKVFSSTIELNVYDTSRQLNVFFLRICNVGGGYK